MKINVGVDELMYQLHVICIMERQINIKYEMHITQLY